MAVPEDRPEHRGPLQVEVMEQDRMLVVRCAGELDMTTMDRLTLALEEALDRHPLAVTIDMEEVGFIDSSGVGVLLGMRARVSKRGMKVTLRPGARVAKVLEALGVTAMFERNA